MAAGKWERARPRLSAASLVTTPQTQPTTWIRPYSSSEAGVEGERIGYGHGFSWLAIDDSAIWATSAASKTATRIDARSFEVANGVELRHRPAAIARGAGAVWIVCANGWLWRLRPDGEGEGVARLDGRARGIACDERYVWVLHAGGDLVQVDQSTGETATEAKIGRGGRQLLYANGARWRSAGMAAGCAASQPRRDRSNRRRSCRT
jgi:hypothetical protein